MITNYKIPSRNKFLFSLRFFFIILFITNTSAQVSKPYSTGYNFTTFTKPQKGNLADWKKFNNPKQYSHPEFGINAENAPCKECVEVLDKRKIDERYFVNVKDTTLFYIQRSLGDLNYLKDGQWLSLNSKIKAIGPNRYESGYYPEPAGFEIDNSRTYIKTPTGKLYFNNWSLWIRTNNIETRAAAANWSDFTIGDNGMYVRNIFDGIDAEMIVKSGAIKTNFIMKKNRFGLFDDLIFRDEFTGSHSIQFDFIDSPGTTEAVGKVIVKGINNLTEISAGVLYPKGGSKDLTQSAAYTISRNKFGVVVPYEWINRLIGQYELVIDPLVTGSATLAEAAITGSRYNASCNFTNSCDYNLNVTQPANTTIDDITFTFTYIAGGACWMEDGGLKFSSGSCLNPAGNALTCNTLAPGTCVATDFSIFNGLKTCMPAPSCSSQVVPFQFKFYRTCFGSTGCASDCIAADTNLTMTIHGRTVEFDPAVVNINANASICAGKSMTVSAAGVRNGVPGYTYNWSFNASGTPSVATGVSASINFPTAGNQTLYLIVTDNCGIKASTSRVITVNTANPAAVTITANPAGAICVGTPVVFTANPVNGGTASYVWRKNGSIVGGNSATYNAGVVNNGDVIIVTMTSTLSCSNSPITSAAYTVVIAATPAPIPDVATLPNITAQCANTTPTSPTAKNPCTGATIIGTAPVVIFNTQGSHTITWTYNDGAGNTSTQTQTVVIDDTQAPIPVIASLPVVTGQCSATRPAAPTANDICKGIITATTTSPANFTTSGTIVWIYNDGNGNTITQNQTVTINDTQAPVPVIASLPVVTGQCSATRPAAPTANDNCAGIITATTTSPATFSTSGTIIWTYNDGNGNIITQNQTVTINDNQAPVPVIASLPVVTGQCSATRPAAPTANDNCAGIITATTTSPATFSTSGIIVWTYNDGNGNTITQNQTVTINDTQAPIPVIASLPIVSGQCSAARPAAPTANDNCAGIITATTTSPATFTTSGIIVWTYNDGNGNTITQNQTVTINDNQAPVPVIASLPVVTGQCSATRPAAPTANDNCAGIITATTTSPATFTTSGIIVWTYNDGNGNTITQNQTVTINDTQAPVPVIASLPIVSGQCSATRPAAPTANDNCAGIITATTTSPATFTTSGTIVWTYNDGNGNTITQNQTVTINDNQAPVPVIASLPVVTGQCSAARPAAPTANDNCAGIITATTTSPATFTTSGTIVWTYNDGNGNTITQNQTVTINDTQAPVPVIASLPVVTGQCSATRPAAPTANDNCAGIITATTTSPATFTTSGTIVWTYNDGNGNTITQNQTVTINDTQAPVPVIASLPVVTGQCSAIRPAAPTANDNCNGIITATTTSPATFTTSGTIVWTYDDGNGNTITQNQTVTINDNQAPLPVIASLPIVSGQCSATRPAAPTANDNCAGIITATTTSPATFTTSGTIVWTYDDGNGNTITQNQTVTINDNQAPVPVIASLPIVSGQCSATRPAAPTANDNCAGIITATTTSPATFTTSGTIVWTYDDGNGNTITQNQTVTINDIQVPVPVIASLPVVTAQCSAVRPAAPTANDNCAGIITATTTSPATFTTSGTIVWTYDDGNGNIITQNQTVTINDTTAPVPNVATLPNITAQCSVNVTAIPSATDNCAGNILGTTTTTLTNITANTTITWTYDDGNGNISTQTQNVIINDTTAPVPNTATLPNVTGQCSVNVTAIPSATDNCSGNIIGTTTDILTNITSNTVITWTYDDGNGNISTQTQNVIINDTTAPVPNLATLPNITAQCVVNVTTIPSATDNCNGNIIGTTTATLTNITTNTVITWTYDDGNGNISTQLQNVIISDTTAPVADLAALPNITAQCSVNVTTIPTATDNCAGAVTATTSTILTNITANTVITWIYADGNGNTTTQLQNVIINDGIAPVPDVTVLPPINGQCSVNVTTIPTATDNCAGSITATTTTVLTNITTNTVITWIYDDGNGNTSAQTQNVIMISDTTAPVPNVASLPNITGQCVVNVTTIPTATDNCAGTVTATTTAVLTNITASTTITWTYNDGNGNTSTQTQNIVVNDTTAPVPNVASLPLINGQCLVNVTAIPSATDNCSGTITATTTTVLTNITSNTVITWTYDDGNGNISTQTQNVVVADTTNPVAIARPAILQLDATGAATLTIAQVNNSSTDNCGIASMSLSKTLFNCTNLGNNTVILTVTDLTGNTNTATATVSVVDNIAPIVTTRTPVNLLLDASGAATLTIAQVDNGSSDNCAIATRTLSKTQFTCADAGANVVQFTVTDSSNNVTVQNVTVNVLENITPVAIAVPTLQLALDANGQAVITVNDIDAGSTDNCGIVTRTISKTLFDCTEVGNHTITLTVLDGSGNSDTATTIVTVLPIPKPTTQKPTQVFCLINNPTVNQLSVNDAQVLWFDSATATTSLTANTPLVSGSYFAAKILGTCVGTDRLEVIVSVNDTNPPVGNNIELVCKENSITLAELSMSGPSVRWYTNATGGTPIDDSTIVYEGDTFYAGLFDGCESSQRLRVDIEFQTCEVIVYNAVSANGDRTNDYLRLEGISFFPENSIEIFNQWGSKVYGTSGYGTSGNVFKGFANYGIIVDKTSPLPFGTYYYILNYVDRSGIRQEKTGYLQLTH